MRKFLLHNAAALIAGLVLSFSCQAVVVKDLYSAEVPVADSSAQALSVGSRQALSEVLVKVSGSTDVLQNPVLVSALKNARNMVQQYAYMRSEATLGELHARFEFDESVVSSLVAKAGAPLWTANRPPVLVWVVVEGPQGRVFLNPESSPEMVSMVTEAFAKRGVPAQFPLYDLNDAALLSVDDLWKLDAAPLKSASQRYGVGEILAGRLVTLSNGEGVGDWSYMSNNSRIDRSIRVGNSEDFLRAGAALVAEEMSGRYAAAPIASNSDGVKMLVSGVSSYADYANIVAWLEGLELIEFANVESIRGDTIQLNLVAQVDGRQLAAIVELNDRLVPVRSPDAGTQLSYQWQR